MTLREPKGALEACAREIAEAQVPDAYINYEVFLAIMRRHGLRGPDECCYCTCGESDCTRCYPEGTTQEERP